MKQVKKAVILTAGLGTRFLPMTKAIPKAMLPILNKPVIQYLVEEAIASGIKEIIIVAGFGKRAIEEHFDRSYELEHELRTRGKLKLLADLRKLEKQARIVYVHQEDALGDGHAILCAEKLIANEPFAVLFGDDIIDAKIPALKQLMEVYKKTESPVICVEKVSKKDMSSYGVIGIESQKDRTIKVKSLVEKPSPKKAPSNFGIIGKYICTPEILKALKKSKSGHKDGEIRLIDGLRTYLNAKKPIYALEIEGERFDTGNQLGLLKANLHFAIKDKSTKESLKEMLDN
ncbi:MAG: UTP--glucose-1-phosphate uridylyltransferase [Candidatus Gracilibacteria bacterium]